MLSGLPPHWPLETISDFLHVHLLSRPGGQIRRLGKGGVSTASSEPSPSNVTTGDPSIAGRTAAPQNASRLLPLVAREGMTWPTRHKTSLQLFIHGQILWDLKDYTRKPAAKKARPLGIWLSSRAASAPALPLSVALLPGEACLSGLPPAGEPGPGRPSAAILGAGWNTGPLSGPHGVGGTWWGGAGGTRSLEFSHGGLASLWSFTTEGCRAPGLCLRGPCPFRWNYRRCIREQRTPSAKA